MLKKLSLMTISAAIVLAVALMLTVCTSQQIYADEAQVDVNYDGFQFRLWVDPDTGLAGSIQLRGYTGTEKTVKFPTHIVYNGVKYPVDYIAEREWQSEDGAFRNNPNIEKIVIPKTYTVFGNNAFAECPNLKEIIIANVDSPCEYFSVGQAVFAGCPNLTTYIIGWNDIKDSNGNSLENYNLPGIAMDSTGDYRSDVDIYLVDGSSLMYYQTNAMVSHGVYAPINPLDDRINEADYEYVVPSGGEVKPAKSAEAGQEFEPVDMFIQGLATEKDPKGSKFGLLQARASKVGKNYIKVSWKKISGAKYVVYGNKCGKTNKYKKIKTVSTTSYTQKKLKAKTYYKYLVVAIKNGKVVSTSKTVHAATTGSKKCGNHVKVTTKAKKNKVSIKKGKTFKLAAKAKTKSKSIRVKIHRGVAYETSNKKIATVSSKGVIKGIKKGKCSVYAYAQNGVKVKIAVTVK